MRCMEPAERDKNRQSVRRRDTGMGHKVPSLFGVAGLVHQKLNFRCTRSVKFMVYCRSGGLEYEYTTACGDYIRR